MILLMRFVPVILGIAALLWLSSEWASLSSVMLLASAIALWIVFQLSWRYRHRWQSIYWLPALMMSSALIPALSTLGIIFKNVWHNHTTPDYDYALVSALLLRIPIWLIAGLCIGFALMLISPLIPVIPAEE